MNAAAQLRAIAARAWRAVVWYAREVSGEARYEHYVERFAREHPGEEPLSEGARAAAPQHQLLLLVRATAPIRGRA
ncbi:YbdD/YjiX family protein [Bifidobacterium pseudolongum]|uniref:Uncharacterized protein n=1 Tax=Bifidobacterium pseudolongum subsp. globosum TaxID=1690 RepID=A0A2N3QTW4_9BIFI|nr:YbdD/YjiX family protein [Bifidobacterium pseudolongum]MCH4835389.1 YbdD/YjiX family protein [Bifidobacterium pseudolongum]MCH4856767.1 YbdD/YjiX family protein [Bifidobacterium pseudolongum]PKU95446.1 hypothetical protein CQR45_1090 [Bifidobacterium pseudolongum subsp. globosum]PKV00229.1 hypothetical protein CQR54_1100 [Bifidobacterium pseudolongum subsp. globosum]RYQ24892.1 carbon starvation protein A [Bifidobacterium pseudolongum subsp. globosum]